jgi:hypothetical protein
VPASWQALKLGATIADMVKVKKSLRPSESALPSGKVLRAGLTAQASAAVLPRKAEASPAHQPLKFVVLTPASSRYRVFAPALQPKHVTAEELKAAVLSLVR